MTGDALEFCQSCASSHHQDLVPCGVTSITVTESTWDSNLNRLQRTTSEQAQGPVAPGELDIIYRMTAPPEGACSGKTVTLSATPVGGCGFEHHLVWADKGAIEFEDEIFAPAPSGRALTRWLLEEAATSPEDNRDAAVASAVATSAVVRGTGLATIFDAIYRPIFARNEYDIGIYACGNPATTSSRVGNVQAIVYPSEKYSVALSFPPAQTNDLRYISRASETRPAGWDQNPDGAFSFKLKVNDREMTTSVNLYKIYKLARDAEYAIKTIDSLFNAAPVKTGFTISGSVKFLYGSITGEWQWREKDERDVEFYYKLAGKFTLAYAHVEFSYGFELFGRGAAVYGRIRGQIDFDASLSSTEGYEGPNFSGNTSLATVPMTGTLGFTAGLRADVVIVAVDANVDLPIVARGGLELFPQASGSPLGLSCDDIYVDIIKMTVNVQVAAGIWEYNYVVALTDDKMSFFDGVDVTNS